MEIYKERSIVFSELYNINDWKIKIYTISKKRDFNQPVIYDNIKKELPNWLNLKNSFNANNYRIGFLVIHAGNEGVFSIVNWWLGSHMLNTHIFFTEYDKPNTFTKVSGDGLAPCIWELEVINRERISWTNYVLKLEPNPNYKAYLSANFNTVL